jgi:hypothetical protein
MIERLKNELQRPEAKERTINVFFRDDDIDEDEPTLRQLLGLFREMQTPINLEIIPGRLTNDCAEFLRQQDRALFELNQHGWQHINHELAGRKCEFGESRNFDQQLADIAAGQGQMNKAFGDDWSQVFTPPWNRCTANTFRALDELGFAALSKDRSGQLVTGYRFREISITFDLYRWKGEPAMKSPEHVFDELIPQLNELDTVGVMLHHKVMDAAAFDFVRELIETLRESQAVRFHTFQSLLNLRSAR